MLRKTLHFRLLLLSLGLAGGTLLIFSLAIYLGLAELFMANVDTSLITLAETEIASLVDGDEKEIHLHEDSGPFTIPKHKNTWPRYIQLLTPEGKVVMTSLKSQHHEVLPVNPVLLRSANRGTMGWEIAQLMEKEDLRKYRPLTRMETWMKVMGSMEEEDVRLLYVPIIQEGEVRYILQVGCSLGMYHHALEKVWVMMGVGIPIALILIGLGSLYLTSRTLEPVNSITQTAERISEDNLSARLQVTTDDRILGRLIQVFNAMLERLQRAFSTQRQFTADASHEIRSPLAIMRANLELALRRERSPEEYRQVIADNLEEIDRLTRLVEGLLTLARADYGEEALQLCEVDVGELLHGLTRQFQPIANNRGIALKFHGLPETALIRGDRDRLKQLFFNLMENALRYTPEGGKVDISLSPVGEWLKVTVKDSGIGIPSDQLELIFKRFYRVDKARSRHMGGTGLGLAICQWIVTAHQGKIHVTSEEGKGSAFEVWLPLRGQEE